MTHDSYTFGGGLCECMSCRTRRGEWAPRQTMKPAETDPIAKVMNELLDGPPRGGLRGSLASDTDKVVNPKDLIGATKAPLDLVPWGAVVQVAPVFAVGAKKYGPHNWREYKIQRMTYLAAALRHLFADIDGQTIDPETGLPHVAHAIAGLMILLDAQSLGYCVDNRPKAGMAAELIALQTKKPTG